MINNVPLILKHIYSEIKNFTEIAIVHLTGDLNSVLLTAILKESLGKENVYCLSLPYNDEFENNQLYVNPLEVANHLGVNFSKKYIYSLTEETNLNLLQLFSNIPILKNSDISIYNLKNSIARSRMSLIYGLRNQLASITNKKTRVIGCSSLSEDFINAHIFEGEIFTDLLPLSELFESELNQICEFFFKEKIIKPDLIKRSENLTFYENNNSEKIIEIDFKELEKSVRKIASENWSDTEWTSIDELVWERHVSNKNKIQLTRKIALREKFCDDFGFISNRNFNRSLK
jgi:NH3-dependent NAD+ synthetase